MVSVALPCSFALDTKYFHYLSTVSGHIGYECAIFNELTSKQNWSETRALEVTNMKTVCTGWVSDRRWGCAMRQWSWYWWVDTANNKYIFRIDIYGKPLTITQCARNLNWRVMGKQDSAEWFFWYHHSIYGDNGDTKITMCDKLNCAACILVCIQVLLHHWFSMPRPISDESGWESSNQSHADTPL